MEIDLHKQRLFDDIKTITIKKNFIGLSTIQLSF